MFSSLHKRRIIIIIFVLCALSLSGFFVLKAFNENLLFYFTPVDIKARKSPLNHPFRAGGLVEKGSVKRNGLTIHFNITDLHQSIPVVYTGILPDLFREGQGIIVRGQIDSQGTFIAEEVLAKHDENYRPPNIK
jgi:cytochrome c-type biogenesis protein CcmE